jgi:hypothetical protein
MDSTLARIDRVGGDPDRMYYSGKHHQHGVNLQGLVDPRPGDLVWISDGMPGSTHDLTAARTHGIIPSATRAEVLLLADKLPIDRFGVLLGPRLEHPARSGLAKWLDVEVSPTRALYRLSVTDYFRQARTVPRMPQRGILGTAFRTRTG